MPEIFSSSQIQKPQKTQTLNKKAGLSDFFKTAFSSFTLFPKELRFETQEDGEDVILLLRRHWITNFWWFLAFVLAITGPTVIFPLFSFYKVLNFLPLRYQTIGAFLWYVLTFSFAFIMYINWYFNVYIVTNRRVVDVDFYNLLYKEVSSCMIKNIQDVTYQVGGTLGVMFNFGTILIQTAGTEENFEFEATPKPAIVVRKIMELIGKKT